MRLPHLDQRLHLHWGEAEQLAFAIEFVLCQQLELEHPARVNATLALTFGALYRVRGRLTARKYQEQRHVGPLPKKPWQLTVRYDELIALMRILPFAPAAGGAWGEVQRAKLNLETYLDFAR